MTAEEQFELPEDGYCYELVDRDRRVLAAGTRLVWIVEPATRRVHVYRSPHEVQVIDEDGELSGCDVPPALRCAVKRLFPA